LKKINRSIPAYSYLVVLFLLFTYTGCGVYSFSGASTLAKTINISPFYNNTDLATANLGQTFTNRLKDYYQRNSSLSVVTEQGELQIEGTIIDYKLTPMAPTAAGSTESNDSAALTRLTIGIRATYVDNLNPANNFKDKVFSFYADFPNTENFTTVQEDLEKKVFDQILIDIFNATIANW
jgi:hypothetical protein